MFDLVGILGCIFFVWRKNFNECLYFVLVWIWLDNWRIVLMLWFKIFGFVFINIFKFFFILFILDGNILIDVNGFLWRIVCIVLVKIVVFLFFKLLCVIVVIIMCFKFICIIEFVMCFGFCKLSLVGKFVLIV